MTTNEYLTIFQNECHKPSVEHAALHFFESYTKYAPKIHTAIISNFKFFFSLLLDLQHNNLIANINHITISYLFSELMCGNPQLLFEIYPSIPFMEHSIVSKSFKAAWVLPEWEQYPNELISLARKAGIINAVHEPYIRSMSWALGRDLLHVASTYIKTQMIDIPQIKEFQSLKISGNFEITFGEYMGWQRTIFAMRPNVDIFNCESSEDLTFRTFERINYEDKSFNQLDLSDSIFHLCTFKNCKFKDVKFCDARFEGCNFISCQFQDIRLDGASFEATLFQSNLLNSIHTNCITQCKNSVFCGFGSASFYNCNFNEAKILNSDFSLCNFEVCQVQNCSVENCTLSDSMQTCFQTKDGEDS